MVPDKTVPDKIVRGKQAKQFQTKQSTPNRTALIRQIKNKVQTWSWKTTLKSENQNYLRAGVSALGALGGHLFEPDRGKNNYAEIEFLR